MEIRIPEVGESVREALLAKWFKKNGELVRKDEPLCEIETDKITLDLNSDSSGILSIEVKEGSTVAVGSVIGTIVEEPLEAHAVSGLSANRMAFPGNEIERSPQASSPSVRREMREQGIVPDSVTGSGKGGRITLDDLSSGDKGSYSSPTDVEESSESASNAIQSTVPAVSLPQAIPSVIPPKNSLLPDSPVHGADVSSNNTSREERKPMSPIRKRISERLVAALQQTAMLTTFNEADLSRVKELRERYHDQFQKRHGAALGLMPFFVKACVEALREYPAANACIEDNDLVFHNYFDIGIAIGAEKGLVVPILRNADRMRMFEIDQAIAAYAEKIKTNQLALNDLEGGTFSISNGGVYGSMLSTPIINLPQSAVLGMHAIQERPVVRAGQIVIRPMMYLALSYDHRIIDGREAVGFLKKVKEYIEEPEELLLEG